MVKTLSGVTNFTVSDTLKVKKVSANNSLGTLGQVLTTNGSATYWATPVAEVAVNTAAQYVWTNTHIFNANVTVNAALIANGSSGTAGQVLHSNGTAIYWAADDVNVNTTYDLLAVANTEANKGIIRLKDVNNANDDVYVTGAGGVVVSSNASHIVITGQSGDITGVNAGDGLTGTTTSGEAVLSVLANTGIIANATGTYVNAAYIATIASNSSNFANLATYVSTGTTTNAFNVGTGTYFLANGNVGMGVSTTPYKLYVNSGSSTTTSIFKSSGSSAFIGIENSGQIVYYGSDSTGSFLIQTPGNSFATKFIVSSSGNVGIGNTALTDKLSVNGTSYFGANVTLTAALIANSSAGSAGQVLHSNGSATYWAADDNTNTTYDLLTVANTEANKAIIRLQDSSSANDDVFIIGANGINTSSNSTGAYAYAVGGNTVTVNTTGIHVNTNLSITTLTLSGNLTVGGGVTVIGANTLSIVDNFIYLNANNTTENVDLGFAGNYNDGTYRHAGFFRDASDGYWKVFDGYAPEPDANVNIDTSNTTFNIAGFWASNLRLGNTSVYATINSTSFSGTSNNANFANVATYVTTATTTNTFNVGASTYFVSNGNVGIGNTNPTEKLVVNGAANISGYKIQNESGFGTFRTPSSMRLATDANGIEYKPASFGHSWFVANTEYMRLDGSGNLGIGTISPDIFGRFYTRTVGVSSTGSTAIQLNGGSGGYGAIDFGASATRTSSITGSASDMQIATVTTIPILFSTNSNERMRIDSNGNVGIGTVPGYKFEVFGTNDIIALTDTRTSSGVGVTFDNSIRFNDFSGEIASVRAIHNGYWVTRELAFDVNGAERIRINGNGNVGIGETNPQRKLTVRADSTASLTAAAFYNADTTNNNGTVFSFRSDTTGTGAATFQEFAAVAARYEIHDHATRSGSLDFFTVENGTGANRLRVAANGNIGISTTSPSTKLHLVGTSGTILIRLDDAVNPRNNYIGVDNYEQVVVAANESNTVGATPNIKFRINASELMRILPSGNVGIGTTAPSAKLTVNGDVLASGDIRSTSAGSNQGNFQASMSGSGAYLHMVRPGYQAWYLASPLNSPDFYISEGTGAVADSKMYFKSGGNIGIGTASPSQRLTVANGQILVGPADNLNSYINFYSTSYRVGASSGLEIQTATSDTIRFIRGTSETARISSTGNFGIGTASPSSRLHVTDLQAIITAQSTGAGAAAKLDFITPWNGVDYTASISNDWVGAGFLFKTSRDLTNSQGGFVFQSASGTNSMVIRTNSGNIGIGTDSPAARLHVKQSNDNSLSGIRVSRSSNDAQYGLLSNHSGATFIGTVDANNAGNQILVFNRSSDGSTFTESMRIAANGYVGIGTSSPANKLQVDGSVTFNGNRPIFFDSGLGTITIKASAGGWATGISFLGSNNTSYGGFGAFGSSDDLQYYYVGAAYNSAGIYVSNTNNVGIGVTSPSVKLDIDGKVLIRSENADALRTRFIAGKDSPGTGNGSLYLQYGIAQSVIVGDGITTSNFYVNSGNVGIGTTSSSSRLTIVAASATDQVPVTISTSSNSSIFLRLSNQNNTNGYIGYVGDSIALQANNSTKLLVSGNGNVGIGTISPNSPLHVTGDIFSDDGIEAQAVVAWGTPHSYITGSGGTAGVMLDYTSDVGNIRAFNNSSGTGTASIGFITAGSERVRITSNGDVGIGTTAPLNYSGYTSLTIGSTTSVGLIKLRSSYNSGNGAEIYQGTGGSVWFNTNSTSTWMLSDSAGNVGIGTTSPTSRLNVSGGQIRIQTSGTYSEPAVIAGILSFDSVGGQLTISSRSNGGSTHTAFFTSDSGTGAERVRISANGNVGIGTTTPAAKLDVNGEIRALSISGYNLSNNAATIDTGLTPADFTILEAFGSANPNAEGSSNYRDPIHLYIYKGTGWNGSAVTEYVYAQSIAPPARSAFPSGGAAANENMSVVWVKAGVESDTCPLNDATYSLRIKISNYATTSYFNLRIVRRF